MRLAFESRCGRAARAWVAGAATALVASCASAPLPAPGAHLTLDNRADAPWRIVATPATGGTSLTWEVAPRQLMTVALPAGNYHVLQTLHHPDGSLDRTLDVALTAGEAYHWPLVTLLAAPGGPR